MFEAIRRLFVKTGNSAVVTNAVSKRWITQEEADTILA